MQVSGPLTCHTVLTNTRCRWFFVQVIGGVVLSSFEDQSDDDMI